MLIRLILSLAVLLSGISACTRSPDCHKEEVFCAGLVTDTEGLNDFGPTQGAWAGLEQSKMEGVVDQIAYIESVDARDYEKNIAFFAVAGYDVIVTSGTALHPATLQSADLYPAAVFVGMAQSGEDSLPNFIPVVSPEDQMGFLAGLVAGRLTKTKIVGAVCEASGIGSMWRYCEGFRAGVTYADKSVKAVIVYHDDESRDPLFMDPAWGGENARSLIKGGADVIFAVGGETAAGALRAAGRANAWAIGAERDQKAALGGEGQGIVASVLGRTSLTIQDLMRKVKTGNPPDMQVSPIGYIPDDSFIPRSLTLEMDEILVGLSDGSIMTNVTFEKP